jgi:hypothetical protein
MKIWIYWSESNSWLYFLILNKNWKKTCTNKVLLVLGQRTGAHCEDVDLVSLGIFFHDKKIDLNFFIMVLCYSFYFFSGSCKEKCYHCWRRHEKNTNAGQAKERRKKNDGKLMLSKIIWSDDVSAILIGLVLI